ncbi:MAG: potassium channel family protein [Candidatus Woesearchaeota archaeon]
MDQLQLKLLSTISVVVILLVLGTIVYMNLENWSAVDALYFSVSTLSTVGYGDLYPTTDASKLFTAFYIIIGVAIVLYAFALLAGHYFDAQHPLLESRFLKAIGRVYKKKGDNKYVELNLKAEENNKEG